MYCLQEVRWRGHVFEVMRINGRFKLWYGNGYGVGVGIMAKNVLCEVKEVEWWWNLCWFWEKKENFISITCYISSACILKYIIQLVIEGKIKIYLYMIFPNETKLT